MTPSAAADELLAHAGFLARLARALTDDAHAAADLVQETYRVALERPPRAGAALAGWLATVATNLARNARRGRSRRGERERATARTERVEPDELALERLETQRALVELVLALPAEQRTVLHERYFEDRAPSAIAARLGVPLKTVKTRHTRALAALRERLDARSGGDRSAWMSALLPLALPRAAPPAAALAVTAAAKALAVTVALAGLAFAGWWGLGPRGLGGRWAASRAGERVASVPLETDPAPPAALLAPEAAATGRAPVVPAPATTGALEVRLAWPDGSPAADVGVDVTCANDPAPREESFRAVTDAGGVARFPALFAGFVRVRPDLRGWFDAEVEAGTSRTVSFTLAEGLAVEGRVLDPAGEPVAGAEVWGGHGHRCRKVASSAADGTFRLLHVDESLPIGARMHGFESSPCYLGWDLPVAPGGTRTVALRLGARAGRVTGRVLDPDGRPLAGARVLVGPRGGHNVETPERLRARAAEPVPVTTAADGTFELPHGLAPGRHPVHATARGFPVREDTVDVAEGHEAFVEIRLEHGARIEGRVLGVGGEPAAGVRVVAAEEDRGGWYWEALPASEDITDEQGWFQLDWIASGTRELNAHDDDRPEIGRARARVSCQAGETARNELRLELGPTIAGQVVDEGGVPLEGWVVQSESSMQRWWYPRRAVTDAQGRFRLYNLGEGAHGLAVRAPDLGHPRAELEEVPVGSEDLVIVVPRARDEKGLLRGRVVAPASDLANLELTLWKVGGDEGQFLTVDVATGAFEALAFPGRYRVKIGRGTQDVAASAEFELTAGGATDVGELFVDEPGRVEIELTGFPAHALERIHFGLDREGASSVALSWSGGRLVAPEVMPGRWTVSMAERELVLRDPTVDVVSGTTTRVAIPIEIARR